MKNKLIVMAALIMLALALFVACQPITPVEQVAMVATPVATEEAVEEGHTHAEGEEHSHDMSAEGEMHLMDNLGSHTHTITTGSDMAQQYFNQGLILAYAFNHELAVASFQDEARPSVCHVLLGHCLGVGAKHQLAHGQLRGT